MRLPPSRVRRLGQSSGSTLTVASVLANVVLTGMFLYVYYGCTGLRGVEEGVSGQTAALVQDLQVEMKNVSTTLEEAYAALQRKDAEIAEAKAKCRPGPPVPLVKVDSEAARGVPGSAAEKLWLTIGIPTIPRRNDTDYLTRTLGSLLEELPLDTSDLLYKRVKVLVMNNRPGKHIVWDQVRERIFGAAEDSVDEFSRKGRLYVEFVDNPGDVQDPAPNAKEPDDNNNPTSKPGREVRRQTCDLISLLEMAQPLSTYYVFMEDDFRVCPYMLRALSYAVRKLNSVPEYGKWLGLRFSYGMNGILVHNEDLISLTAYLRKHTVRLPPDLLWTEWYTGRRLELRPVTRGRKLAVFRLNLLDHLGARSSFSVRTARPGWPRCYHPMSDMWSLSRTEKFNERACRHSDISPCPAHHSSELWLKHPIQWPNVTEGADLDHPILPADEVLPASPAAALISNHHEQSRTAS